MAQRSKGKRLPVLEKAPTGIAGFDEITLGGVPRGRPTLICGGPGSGKTLFGMEFLVRGATEYGEPGVFMSFEESIDEMTRNVASLGFDLKRLAAAKKVFLDYVHVERSEIEETGEYDLEGLFIRLNDAITTVGAKRVVLDTLESLFSGLPNPLILRAELRRLFRWLKAKGLTAIITGEQGTGALTRHGLEEYISDCVILLDHRVSAQVSTRRMRIVKYRGSTHGTNEYPFLIDEQGIVVLPITSLGLHHGAGRERVSSGIPRLDAMLGGKGFFRASSILVSGTAGTGKTSIASEFLRAGCRRGEKCIFFSFEESPSQIMRNMLSIGIDLQVPLKRGLLKFHAERPTIYGLEAHLTSMHKIIADFKPRNVVIDPVSNLHLAGIDTDVKMMLTRLIDFLKMSGITSLFTNLTSPGITLEQTEVGISSMADAWLLLRDLESGGERNRVLYVLKCRGTAHSNQVREFLLTDHGVDLLNVYVGPAGVLTGTARIAQEAKEREAERVILKDMAGRKLNLKSRKETLEAQIAAMRAEYEREASEVKRLEDQESARQKTVSSLHKTLARMRQAD
jgi:circadian clock protein KaiC